MSLRPLKLSSAYLGVAMLCAAGFAACLLPDYQNGCPSGAYTERFGSDADRAEWSAFARAPDGSSAIAGVFYTSLTWTNGKAITATETKPATSDAFIVGMDSAGQGIWAVTVAGTAEEGVTRLVPIDGGFLALGRATGTFTLGGLTSSTFSGGEMGWLAMIANDGTPMWLDTFRVDDGTNHFVGLADAVVDPTTQDIVVVGDAIGTLAIERTPDALPAVSPMALMNVSPFYVHLDPNGKFADASALQVWPSQNQSLVTKMLLGPDGSRYVFGGFSGIFPDAGLQNAPPLANNFDAFVMRVDGSDVAQEAYKFGSPERQDAVLDAYLSDDSFYVLFHTSGGPMPPTMGFDIGGDVVDVSGLGNRGGVVARVGLPGNAGKWGKVIALDQDFGGSIGDRNGDPLISVRYQPDQATFDGHTFTTSALSNTVFLRASAADGHLLDAFDFGPTGIHVASLAALPCGDTVFGTFAQGPVALGGQTFTPTTSNVFVSFLPDLKFSAPP